MQRLAKLAQPYFLSVTGSDATYSEVIDQLVLEGIGAYVGTDERVIDGADIVVYSSAISDSNVELSRARLRGIPTLERGEFLGIFMRSADVGVAIAGTHGKSTTTAILGNIMRVAHMSATVHVGATSIDPMPMSGTDYFVTEACEYNRALLHLDPYVGVVLNVDYDHPDIFKGIEDVRATFDMFMDRCDIVVTHESVARDGAITFGGSDSADYRICNITRKGERYTFDIEHEDVYTRIVSPLYGIHNINNVTAAYVIARVLSIDETDIITGIETFGGLERRFEKVGVTREGAIVIHDYAHHPEEIRRTIATAQSLTHHRVIVVFEPHTYSRTRSLLSGFLDTFYWADSLILLPTFSARETPEQGYTTLELIEHMRDIGEYPLYFESYKRTASYLHASVCSGDIILVVGAGRVDHLAHMLVE